MVGGTAIDYSTLADEIAAVAHRCLCKRMLKAGWRPGGALDLDAMTHDALRLYAELSPERRARLRQSCAWDDLEPALADSAGSAGDLDKPGLSLREIYVGMGVRLTFSAGDEVGRVVSWSASPSEPEVLDEITVAWPNGDVVEYSPAEQAIEPAGG